VSSGELPRFSFWGLDAWDYLNKRLLGNKNQKYLVFTERSQRMNLRCSFIL
jgi:hypothetical protein